MGLDFLTQSFSYKNIIVHPAGSDGKIRVSFDITNTGDRDGAEIAQVYVHKTESGILRAVKELKAFTKVFLKPGRRNA